MEVEQYIWGFCFFPLDANGQKFFGFSEYLTGLTLMVLAWTIADIRYKFRVRSAPIPLLGITFSVIVIVGVLTLLTDLWRAEQWLVPKGNLLTPATWQAFLAGMFLLNFLTWTWFAFIKPPTYGRLNAERFARNLYQVILKGSPTELAIIADELTNSASSLVRHATDRRRADNHLPTDKSRAVQVQSKVEAFANDLLLLIADKRLCRAIVESSPGTALGFFQAISDTKKFGVQVQTFAKNITNEALNNKDSFLYHEANGYESGLIGYHKPLSQSMFANHEMVEEIGTLIDIDTYSVKDWDASQWKAYCRVVLMTFRSHIKEGHGRHSFVLYRAKGYIENAASDLYRLNEQSNEWDTKTFRILRVVIEFIKDTVKVLNENQIPKNLRVRLIEEHRLAHQTFYDHIASMIFEVIFHASAVRSPKMTCWSIQHNSVWGELFSLNDIDGPAGKIVKFKVRRLLYNEISRMKSFPNFKGAKILGYCLNVMGLAQSQAAYDKDSRALHKAVLSWTRKNFIWLHEYNQRVGDACLVEGITYDSKNLRLVRTALVEGLRVEPSYVYLELNPPPEISSLEN